MGAFFVEDCNVFASDADWDFCCVEFHRYV